MIMDIKQGGQVNQDRGCAQWSLSNPTLHVRVCDLTVSMFLIVQNTNAKILGSIKEGVYFRLLMGVNNNPIYRSLCNFLVLDVPIDQRYKITRYANLFLSVDFTCRNQLQQSLSVCQFRHVCISCFYHLYNLYWIGILVSIV